MATRATPVRTPRLLADQRALELLRELLTAAEFAQITTRGYLEIPSPGYAGRVYRIPRGPGFVQVLEHDTPVFDLCVQPVQRLPRDDVVLMHKLLIEAGEEDYLAKANRFPRLAAPHWTLASLVPPPPVPSPAARPAPPASPPTPLVVRPPALRRPRAPRPPGIPARPAQHDPGLQRADLQGRNLRGMSLIGENLREANLAGTDLQRATLTRADLREADLRGADLFAACLDAANLREADLRRADLRGIDARAADLSGALLQRALLAGADLSGADLRGAKLEGARHNAGTRWPAGFDPAAAGAVRDAG